MRASTVSTDRTLLALADICRSDGVVLRSGLLPGSPGALLHRGPLRTTHARSRARGPSKPRRAVHTALKVLRRIRRASVGGPPVRSPRCSTCPSVPASAPLSLQRLTCPRRRPCGHEHQARYPASYTSTIREETRPCGARFPCCLSAAGIRFLGTLSRQWTSAPLTIGIPPCLRIPAPAWRTLARFTRSARMRPDRAGRLLYPGNSGVHRPSGNPWPSPAVSQRLVPATPAVQSSPGCRCDEASARFPGSRPIGLPRTCGRHGWCSGPWAFPRAPHPTGREPATHVTAGTGRTQPVAMSPASAGPPRLAHSSRATSCRNHRHRRASVTCRGSFSPSVPEPA